MRGIGILTVTNSEFYMDGAPYRIVSGTIHYFRVVPEYWEDRLRKLKECGFNTVETYTCWNLHERKEGQFDFAGRLDVVRFIEIAGRLGLKVILRPGPYICAEWDMGGLPSWLLAIPGMKFRCYHEGFIQKVRTYYHELFQRITPLLSTNGGNIIMVQIENEYGSFGDDSDYMKAIREIYRENHVDCQLFTSDGPGYFMLHGGAIEDELATVNFGSNPKDNFALLKNYRPESPLMCTEYWNGWFDHWYEKHHVRDGGDTAEVFEEMLKMGASVNFYMFHGGTNFGFCNGANFDGYLQPTVTSYDYNCPLSESGDITPKYREIRKVMERNFGPLPELTVSNSKKIAYGAVELCESADMLLEAERGNFSSGTETSPYLKSMEELGVDFGFVLYSSELTGPMEQIELSIDGLNDRAHIFVNGKLLGIKENTGKRDDTVTFGLNDKETVKIDLLVENLGRVNYGGHITDGKGITGGVRMANRYHYGWKMTKIFVDEVNKVEYLPNVKQHSEESFRPTLLRGYLHVEETADTFIRLDGFKKGCVWVNGFNLGRYWNEAGPQKTLYLPAPLLKQGENEFVVLELDGYTKPILQLTSEEDLG